MLTLKYVMQDTSVLQARQCKFLVLLASIIQALEQFKTLARLVKQETTASTGTLCPVHKLRKNLPAQLVTTVLTQVLMLEFPQRLVTTKM